MSRRMECCHLNAVTLRNEGQRVFFWIHSCAHHHDSFFLLAAAWVDPGGAPLSQLNKGVKDAMVESTGLVVRQFMTKTCKKAINTNNNNLHKVTLIIMIVAVIVPSNELSQVDKRNYGTV